MPAIKCKGKTKQDRLRNNRRQPSSGLTVDDNESNERSVRWSDGTAVNPKKSNHSCGLHMSYH